jgi:bacterioferritin
MDKPTAGRLALDEKALDDAKRSLDDGAVTPSYGPWRDDIVQLLNDALATEIVCVLRYKRHYHTTHGMAASNVAEEFLEHATAEAAHADRIAERIVQLGGEPDFSPDSLTRRSHAEYDDSSDVRAMIRANLVA